MANKTPGPDSHCTDEVLAKVEAYIDGEWETKYDHTTPSVLGLVRVLKVHRSTIYRWKEVNPYFNDLMDYLSVIQEHETWEKGFRKQISETLCKLQLANFGHSDKIVSDHTSSDGSMTPKPTRVELVAPKRNDDSAD